MKNINHDSNDDGRDYKIILILLNTILMKNARCSVFVFFSKYYKSKSSRLHKEQIIIGRAAGTRADGRQRSDGIWCSRWIPVRQKKTCNAIEKFMLA
jgi:hypothetical protein